MRDFEKCKLAYKWTRRTLLYWRWQVYRLVYFVDHNLLEVFNRVQKSFARRRQERDSNEAGDWIDSPYRRTGEQRVLAGDDPDWGQVDGATLQDAISAVNGAGHALLFTHSSDGGALGLVVCMGDRRRKFYSHDVAAIERKLGELIEQFPKVPNALRDM